MMKATKLNQCIAAAGICLLVAGGAQAAIIVGYDFPGTLNPSIVIDGVTPSLYTGANVPIDGVGGANDFVFQDTLGDNTGLAASGTTFGSTAAGNFSGTANDATGGSLVGAISAGDYVRFGFAADSGLAINISGFSVAGAIAGGKSAEFFNVLAKVDGDTSDWVTTDALFGSTQEIEQLQGLNDWDDFFVDLSGNSTLQGISSVEFRIYLWGGSGNTSSSRTDYDQIVVEGTVIPEPSTLIMLGVSGLMLTLVRRRRG